MARQTQQSALMQKYGDRLRTAVEQHADDETALSGFQDLPPGITNGVAQITEVKFFVYQSGDNKGEYGYRAEAVVLHPEEVITVNGVERVAGKQFNKMIPLCDTVSKQSGRQRSMDENVAAILNEMRLLADGPGPAHAGSFTQGATGNDLEDLARQLTEAAPTFAFATRASGPATPENPTPRVWTDWLGYTPWDPEAVQGVEANGQALPSGSPAPRAGTPARAPAAQTPATLPARTPVRPATAAQPGKPANGPAARPLPATGPTARPAAPAPAPGKPVKAPAGPARQAAPPRAAAAPAPAPTPPVTPGRPGSARKPAPPAPPTPAPVNEEVPFDEFGDLDGLAERADAAISDGAVDEEAEVALTEAARQAGISDDEINGIENWAALVELIRGGVPAAGPEGDEANPNPDDNPPWSPQAGEVYLYAPVNPRTKRAGKPVDVEVVAVNTQAETCDLKNLGDGKTLYKGVAWAALSGDPEPE